MLEEGKFFENTQSALDIEDAIKKLISGLSGKIYQNTLMMRI